MSRKNILILGIVLQALVALAACGVARRSGGEPVGFDLKITSLPAPCCPSVGDPFSVSVDIFKETPSGPAPVDTNIGMEQEGTEINYKFKKDSVTAANPWVEVSPCGRLKFKLTVTHLPGGDACKAALAAAIGHSVDQGTVIWSDWITPSPCGEWKFGPSQMNGDPLPNY